MNYKICETIRELRQRKGISQEVLAANLQISTQAVSKWETGNSLPDILHLPKIADFFEVFIDDLFYGISNTTKNIPENQDDIKDDGKLRVVQFLGKKLLAKDEWIEKKPISVNLNGLSTPVHIEMWGESHIDGSVKGNIKIAGGLTCQNIKGDLNASGGVTCSDMYGNINASGGITCQNINGNINTNGDIHCTEIPSSDHIRCKNLYCKGSIKCNNMIIEKETKVRTDNER